MPRVHRIQPVERLLGSGPLGQGGGIAAGTPHVPGPYYLLNDTFTTDRAAGAIQGTLAEPGPGVRTGTDTNNKLSLSGGNASFATGGVTSGNPGLWWGPQSRRAGLVSVAQLTHTTAGYFVGFDDNQAGLPAWGAGVNGTTLRVRAPLSIDVGAVATATAYQIAIAIRNTGAVFFIKGGSFSNWTLLYASVSGSDATIYPALVCSASTSVFTCAYVRVPSLLWLPAPSASDGFSAWGTTDGLGHAEGATGLGGGGNGLIWTNQVGTWTASAGVANASALSGGIAIATVDTGVADVHATVKLIHSGGTGSVVVRFADANNFVRLSHTGTNVQLVKLIAGASTTVLDSAQTYVAGAELRLVCEGSTFRCFYNNLAVGGANTIADAAVASATKQGLRTSNTANTFDDFVVRARGSGGEYSALDAF